MIEITATEKGIDKAVAALQALFTDFEAGVGETIAPALHSAVIERTPVGASAYAPGHPGMAKASWGQVEQVSGGFTFGNPVAYVEALEKGLYPKVGKRTVALAGGIFSQQAPGGIVKPLIEDEAFMTNLIVRLVEELERKSGGGESAG